MGRKAGFGGQSLVEHFFVMTVLKQRLHARKGYDSWTSGPFDTLLRIAGYCDDVRREEVVSLRSLTDFPSTILL
jgi:hypothetical protein